MEHDAPEECAQAFVYGREKGITMALARPEGAEVAESNTWFRPSE